MLALIAGLFTTAQIFFQIQQEDARQQAIADQTAQVQRFIEEFRVQEASLQAYLDLMASLLLQHDLRESAADSEVSAIARAQTLTTLRKQDAEGKGTVVRFLYDAGLIQQGNPVIDLATADLSNTDLSTDDLSDANLDEAILRGADLNTAVLSDAVLSDADLRNADLSNADLSSADLSFAGLSHADLCCNADLSSADLSSVILRKADLGGAHLSYANLTNADLSHADLTNADLSGAKGVSESDLERQLVKLENTIMPDGTKHG